MLFNLIEPLFLNYKNVPFFCKKCKNIQITRFQKELVLISKNKIKGNSKCAICFTKRTFTHEIEDKYDLEKNRNLSLLF